MKALDKRGGERFQPQMPRVSHNALKKSVSTTSMDFIFKYTSLAIIFSNRIVAMAKQTMFGPRPWTVQLASG